MLHRVKPIEIVGLFASLTDGPDVGWTTGLLYPAAEDLDAKIIEGWFEISMDIDVAISLAALLTITSHQGRKAALQPRADDLDYHVLVTGSRKPVLVARIRVESDNIKISSLVGDDGDGFDFRFSSALASCLAEKLFEAVSVLWCRNDEPARDAKTTTEPT